jgi:catabolite regulation protein CreA
MTQGGRSAGQMRRCKKAFLDSFKMTGNISESADASGIARSTVYRWQEQDDEFAAGFREAEIKATECLESEARRRAVDGVLRLKFDKGQAIIDPRTGEPYMEAETPEKYRENVHVKHDGRIEHVQMDSARKVLRIAGGNG